MRLARPIFLAGLIVVLTAYAFDCGATTTPEQAMQCCNSMPCSQGHHDEDCCKTMAAMHAPFVQASSTRHVSTSPAVSAVLSASNECRVVDSSIRVIAVHCNAPPILDAAVSLPLRI
jgi:hypothetical protein